jgi:hypothetical protein
MACPAAHEWYELERGTVPREDAEALRRHRAECPDCRAMADEVRDTAALLERLAGHTRADLPAEAVESVFRRAKVHGWLGKPLKVPARRAQGVRWKRVFARLGASLAAVFVVCLVVKLCIPETVYPREALERLVRSAHVITEADRLRPLAPVARAAVTAELARRQPDADQVADLLLVAYICQRPREDRQTQDVDFLLRLIWGRQKHRPQGTAAGWSPWPTLVSTAVAAETPAADALARARGRLLDGDYKAALAALPEEPANVPLRVWCLELLGRTVEAKQVMAKSLTEGDLGRVVKADLALGGEDVAEAMRQYETLAAHKDRYWFAAGYLCRYELRDARSAGHCFEKIHDEALAEYVAQTFQGELAIVKVPEPPPLFSEDWESSTLGVPTNMTLVRTHGGEFRVVEVPGGKALCQEEIKTRGAEFLVGPPDWADYTLRFDVKVLETKGEYAIGASAYRRPGYTGYVLELSPGGLRILKQFAATVERSRTAAKPGAPAPTQLLILQPAQSQARLGEPPGLGWWYTMKIRVQHVGDGVNVAGKAWRSDLKEPLDWQVVWTDAGQGGSAPFVGGATGVQVGGAKVLIDNLVVTQNEGSRDNVAAP